MEMKRVCICAAIAAITLFGFGTAKPSQAAVLGTPMHANTGATINDYGDYGCHNNQDWRYQRRDDRDCSAHYGERAHDWDRGDRDNRWAGRDYSYDQNGRDYHRGRDRDENRNRDNGSYRDRQDFNGR